MKFNRGLFVAASILVFGPAVAAQADSGSYLWTAWNSSIGAYVHHPSVMYDSSTPSSPYKAYWVSTPGGYESEGVYYAAQSAPWNFYTGQSIVLQTSGVRIIRHEATSGSLTDRINQTGANPGGDSLTTLGYLRRTSSASGGFTLAVYECIVGFGNFVTNSTSECTGSGGTPTLLGYALGSPQTGYAPRYRCVETTYPYRHFTSKDAVCESRPNYVPEGPIGYFGVGGTLTVGGTTADVSSFPDGAYVAPNSVIKSNGTYYMTYTSSKYYGFGGPFNQIFLATSNNGVSWIPYDRNGDGLPDPIISYAPGYDQAVIARAQTPGSPCQQVNAPGCELYVAYGVGGGQVMSVGGNNVFYYTDSSYFSGGTQWVWKTLRNQNIYAINSAGTALTDESGNLLSSQYLVYGDAAFAYDNNPAQPGYWLFASGPGRIGMTFYHSTDTTGLHFEVNSGNHGTIPTGPEAYVQTPGIGSSGDGTVDTRYGFYLYYAGSLATSQYCPTSVSNACATDQIAVDLFQ